jgi:Cellulase (glycosyl hydrolase family 5)
VLDSFAAFWRNAAAADAIGIQTRFLAAWKHVAHALRMHTNILGFDPFNEPYPGSAYTSQCGSFNAFSPCPAFEQGALASFYRRVTAAIRAGGAHQIIWPEGVAQNGQAAPALPRFRDGQTAFNFHYYCSQTQLVAGEVPIGQPSPATQQCASQERKGIGTFLSYARRIGVPAILSEFSCNDVDPDNAQVVDLVDRSFISWTAWAYYRSVPDHVSPGDGDDDPVLPSARGSRSEAGRGRPDTDLHPQPPVPGRLQGDGPGCARGLAPIVAVARARRQSRRVEGNGHRHPAHRRQDDTPAPHRSVPALLSDA